MWCGANVTNPNTGTFGVGNTGATWVLAAGDGITSTYRDGFVTMNSRWDTTHFIWTANRTVDGCGVATIIPRTAANGTADYVWIEVSVFIQPNPGEYASGAPATISGTINLEFTSYAGTSEIPGA